MTELPWLPQRLGKLLRERTGLSRTSLEAYYRQGRIEMSRTAFEGLRELVFAEDRVTLDGEPLPLQSPYRYFALHKPLGVVTTVHAPDGAPDLSPWLRTLSPPVFAVGRLDCDSSGLLLLTNDGDLGYALMSPEHHVDKAYRITVRGELQASDPRLGQLAQPMVIDQATMSIAAVALASTDHASSEVCLVLREGKYRQIRKMCRKAGLELTRLHRERIGPVHLETLAVGECRPLEDDEVQGLWQAVGGHHTVRDRQLLALARQAHERRCSNMPHGRLERWLDEHLAHFGVRERQEQPIAQR